MMLTLALASCSFLRFANSGEFGRKHRLETLALVHSSLRLLGQAGVAPWGKWSWRSRLENCQLEAFGINYNEIMLCCCFNEFFTRHLSWILAWQVGEEKLRRILIPYFWRWLLGCRETRPLVHWAFWSTCRTKKMWHIWGKRTCFKNFR